MGRMAGEGFIWSTQTLQYCQQLVEDDVYTGQADFQQGVAGEYNKVVVGNLIADTGTMRELQGEGVEKES